MQRPLQIVFKGMDSSPALEALIRERVDRLDDLHPRLIGCRVVVEVPHRGAEAAKVPVAVSVEAEVAGRGPIVGRDQAERRDAKEDHTVALNKAFEAVERQLDRVAGTRSRQGAARVAEGQSGMVVRVFPEQGYGFVEIDNSTELHFTRNAVVGGTFEEIETGMMVQVTRAADEGPMGPQASAVRLLDRSRTPA